MAQTPKVISKSYKFKLFLCQKNSIVSEDKQLTGKEVLQHSLHQNSMEETIWRILRRKQFHAGKYEFTVLLKGGGIFKNHPDYTIALPRQKFYLWNCHRYNQQHTCNWDLETEETGSGSCHNCLLTQNWWIAGIWGLASAPSITASQQPQN